MCSFCQQFRRIFQNPNHIVKFRRRSNIHFFWSSYSIISVTTLKIFPENFAYKLKTNFLLTNQTISKKKAFGKWQKNFYQKFFLVIVVEINTIFVFFSILGKWHLKISNTKQNPTRKFKILNIIEYTLNWVDGKQHYTHLHKY